MIFMPKTLELSFIPQSGKGHQLYQTGKKQNSLVKSECKLFANIQVWPLASCRTDSKKKQPRHRRYIQYIHMNVHVCIHVVVYSCVHIHTGIIFIMQLTLIVNKNQSAKIHIDNTCTFDWAIPNTLK